MSTPHPHPILQAPSPVARRRAAGFSLIECLIILAVLAIALGLAAPGFEQARARSHLEGAAAQLQTDLQHARSLAVAQGRPLRMSFEAGASGSCYVLHSGGASDCACGGGELAVCRPGAAALHSVRFEPGSTPQLRSNVRSILFDPTRGTATPAGTLRLVGEGGQAVHLVINLMGRVRSCTPSLSLPGYPAC
jgi:type IV fimbrial biogenesis protein FimT